VDNLSHTLAGLVLARAGLGRSTRGGTAALVLASNLPDADIVSALFGSESYLAHHRGASHGVVGAPLLALGLAVVLRMILRESRFLPLLLCSLVGVAGHMFMDLWTSYGTRVLSPFDHTWYAWDLVFIIDPLVWALLGSALFADYLLRRGGSAMGPRAASVGIAVLLAYVGGRAVLHARALDDARHVLPAQGVSRVAAIPGPLNPFRWKLLADDGAFFYSGEIDVRRGPRPLRRREKRPEDAMVARARESSAAATFLDFSRFPWLEVDESEDGWTVSWRDLRFEDIPGVVDRDTALRARQGDGFVARIVLGPDGRIRNESIRF
jgi:inner membrane protein